MVSYWGPSALVQEEKGSGGGRGKSGGHFAQTLGGGRAKWCRSLGLLRPAGTGRQVESKVPPAVFRVGGQGGARLAQRD